MACWFYLSKLEKKQIFEKIGARTLIPPIHPDLKILNKIYNSAFNDLETCYNSRYNVITISVKFCLNCCKDSFCSHISFFLKAQNTLWKPSNCQNFYFSSVQTKKNSISAQGHSHLSYILNLKFWKKLLFWLQCCKKNFDIIMKVLIFVANFI